VYIRKSTFIGHTAKINTGLQCLWQNVKNCQKCLMLSENAVGFMPSVYGCDKFQLGATWWILKCI